MLMMQSKHAHRPVNSNGEVGNAGLGQISDQVTRQSVLKAQGGYAYRARSLMWLCTADGVGEKNGPLIHFICVIFVIEVVFPQHHMKYLSAYWFSTSKYVKVDFFFFYIYIPRSWDSDRQIEDAQIIYRLDVEYAALEIAVDHAYGNSGPLCSLWVT